MYLLDVSIRYLKYFCVLFVLFVFLFMLLASLRCYTSIFDGFIILTIKFVKSQAFSVHLLKKEENRHMWCAPIGIGCRIISVSHEATWEAIPYY